MKVKLLIIAATLLVSATAFADEISFTVTNNTDTKISKILVSEDGEEFGYFDIGSGVAPGKTVKLVWDQSAYGDDCKQYFKAVFSNGEESEAQQFDFCEDDVAIDFE